MTGGQRARTFLRETYRRRVEHVEPYPWGELVVTPSLPRVYDANFAIVDSWDGDVVEFCDEIDRVQSEHGFGHRKVVVPDDELATRLWSGLEQLDWPIRQRSLLMAQPRPPNRPADVSIQVVEVGEEEWRHGRLAMIEIEGHGSDPEVSRQLLELDQRLASAMDVRHLAALVDGEIASYAGLYLHAGAAQIEDVATLPAYRSLGLASAVVLHAVGEAKRTGVDLVFLMADDSDWPKGLYGRLGFDPIGVEHFVTRPAANDS